MAHKYWHLKLKGTKTMDDIHGVIGHGGTNLVRVHFDGEDTHVYVAGEEGPHHQLAKQAATEGQWQETSADAVTKLH